ncbi:MAG: hypothetical protein AAF191_05065 [Verrucomicrobiota bacterium]
MPRAKNAVETVQITMSTTQQIRQFLEELTSSGLYGKNVAETANALVAERIRELLKEGELQRVVDQSGREDSS